jgi:branched-chain amino acid transport system permease protein
MNYFLSDMNPQYWQFWLGLILVLIVLFARGGILGTARQWIESSRQRARSRSDRRAHQ